MVRADRQSVDNLRRVFPVTRLCITGQILCEIYEVGCACGNPFITVLTETVPHLVHCAALISMYTVLQEGLGLIPVKYQT